MCDAGLLLTLSIENCVQSLRVESYRDCVVGMPRLSERN